jgi:pimeloyl-ACP methyl ester carboxylesterase
MSQNTSGEPAQGETMADIVLIHGAGDSAAIWDRQVEALGRAHRLHALDLPGHGARQAESAHAEHSANAAEVSAALERAGIERAVVVGHSMGGAVALAYALRGGPADGGPPPRLRALVLVGTGARLRMHPSFLEAARRRAEGAAAAPPEQAESEPIVPLERCLGPAASADTLAWLRAHAGQASAQALYADFCANDAFDVMGQLGAVAVPTLVVGGVADSMTPPKYLQYLAEAIPGARLALIDGAGHYPMVEEPDAFNRHLSAFLAELS